MPWKHNFEEIRPWPMIWNNFATNNRCRFISTQCMRCCMWCFWWFFDDSILITGSRFVGIFQFLFRFWFRAWSYWLYWAWSKCLIRFSTLKIDHNNLFSIPRWSAIFITRSNILEWAQFFIFYRLFTEFHKANIKPVLTSPEVHALNAEAIGSEGL